MTNFAHNSTVATPISLAGVFAWLSICCIVLAGCGMADQMTITDTNDPTVLLGDSGQQPAAQYGADVLARSVAMGRARGKLAQARELSVDKDSAATVPLLVQDLSSSDWPLLREAALLENPTAAGAVDESLARSSWNSSDLTALDKLLTSVDERITPRSARSDAAYRAAVIALLIDEAAAAYGDATVTDGDSSEGLDGIGWGTARGILLFVETELLPTLPPQIQEPTAAALSEAFDALFSTVVPQTDAPSLEVAEPLLTAISDPITTSGIDTSAPSITKVDLDAVDVAIDALNDVQSAASVSPAQGKQAAERLQREALRPVVAALAYLAPEEMIVLESSTGSKLRSAIATGDDAQVASAIVAAQKSLESARSVIQDEFDVLSDSEE